MSEPSIEQIESMLGEVARPQPSEQLREQVLRNVRRELRAIRWERRLARLAACLLLVGAGLNVAAMQPSRTKPHSNPIAQQTPARVAELAVDIANLTDAETGRRFAMQMAALNGWSLSDEQGIALESEMNKQL